MTKYYAILIDRNGFSKEIEIDDLVPYIDVPIKNPGTHKVFMDSEDYMKNFRLPSIERKTFYRKNEKPTDVLVSKDKTICWCIYEEY